MRIQLTWTDPTTGKQQNPFLETPVAIGKEFAQMPSQISGNNVSRMVIKDDLIADYHVLIDYQNQDLILSNQTNLGTQVNGQQVSSINLQNGDTISIGICQITINYDTPTGWSCDRMVGFLFKRRCSSTDPTNCPYCQNNSSDYNEYSYYQGYGSYGRGYWGNNYYRERDHYSYNSETGNVDFTEADTASFEQEDDGDFETDMGAS